MSAQRDTIEEMDKAEQAFAQRSAEVFAAARERVLAMGQPVTFSEGDVLIRLFPDGTRTILQEIQPPRRIGRGTKIRLR
ncbi:MAG: hypothetical protein IT368_14495 [Candidatus Hydrogenedentes bacterium]|nr:hypothetical protein [Candidatus Hydrogenedentota bacterium]